jgi:hypothetical protein
MNILQLLFVIILSLPICYSHASWVTEPYLGFGQLSLKLGDEVLINGEATSYSLGIRSGIQLGQNLVLAADYSRAGPYQVKFKVRHYGTSIDSGYFTLYSGGLGLRYTFGNWMLWAGQYPYHVLEEHKIDFQLKGTMKRVGIGLTLDSKTNIYFHYDTSSVSMSQPSSTAQSIICYNTIYDECTKTGTSTTLFFAISSTIN